MKRAAVVGLSVWLASVMAQAGTVLSMGRSSGAAGALVEVPVGFASGDQVVGIQIDFGYDAGVVVPGTVRQGADVGAGYEVASAVVAPGRLRVVLYSLKNLTIGDGNVLLVPLSLSGTVPAGSRGLEILQVQLADAAGLNRSYALAPYVEIRSPGRGSEPRLGEPVAVEVEAYAAAGSLTGVQVFVDGQLVGQKVQGPYTFSWTPSQRGRHELLVVATDSADASAQSQRALQVLSNFDDWVAGRFSAQQRLNPFVSGVGGDPDLDGVVNGIEYITGGDPLGADADPALRPHILEVGGARYLGLTIETPLAASDAAFSVYATGHLDRAAGAPPQAAVLHEQVTDAERGVIRRTYRDPVPMGGSSRFMYIESSIRP